MGDGYINRGGKNPYIHINMISEEYLKYVDRKFGVFGHGVSLWRTAEEGASRNRENGFRPDAKSENYSDTYWWRSMSHPELKEFSNWYNSGDKVWPDDIRLTPTTLKHWYCGDGNSDNGRIRISMSNEYKNTDKVDQMFLDSGLPTPSNYDMYEVESGRMICNAQFTVDDSKELWEYMGESLPDFEYKWP